jgi:hypothetical protein
VSWDKVKSLVSKSAPLLGTLIGGPVGSAVTLVASALGTNETPDAIEQAIKADPEAALKLRTVEDNNRTALEQAIIAADVAMFSEQHKTIRAELASEDKFKSYWRPAFGYAMVLTWCLTWFALGYVIIFETDKAQMVVNALANTTALWGIALAVLGVQITKRTHDKQVGVGQNPKGIIEGLATLIRKQ